jgi:chloramphenicol 3-O-phosphotransferase
LNEGRLVVVTGPSHAGKTTTIEAVRRELSVPSAVIAIDDIIASLDLGSGELWKDGLPVAYDVAAAAAAELLRHRFVVFLESTFTYIPGTDDDEPQLHREQLERLLQIARVAAVPSVVVGIGADLRILQDRHAATGRLDSRVIERIWTLHRGATLAETTVVVDTTAVPPREAAALVLAALERAGIATLRGQNVRTGEA